MSFLYRKKHQAGAAAAISIFILLVVIAGMLTTALYSSSSSISSSVQQQGHQKALFLAETGLEVAQHYMDENNLCTNVPTATGAIPYGDGSYEITASVLNAATDGCEVTVIGKSNGVVSTFKRSMLFTNATTGGNYLEPFPSDADFNTDWSVEVLTKTQGTARWNAANCDATCANAIGGSLEIRASGWRRQFVGYRERVIPTINTGASGLTVDLTGAFKKHWTRRRPRVQEISIELQDSTNNVTTQLWVDRRKIQGNVWAPIATSTALPANRIYDRLRVSFSVRTANRGKLVSIGVDEINLSW